MAGRRTEALEFGVVKGVRQREANCDFTMAIAEEPALNPLTGYCNLFGVCSFIDIILIYL